MNTNYYAVETMCGHVGKRKYIPVIFAVRAGDGKEAASIARLIPRVKHHNKFAILGVKKVSKEEYLNILDKNNKDVYLSFRTTEDTLENYETIENRIRDFAPSNKSKQYDRYERLAYQLKKRKSIDRCSRMGD